MAEGGPCVTTSQLVRIVFQSTMGSYEGAFSAARPTTHRSAGGTVGEGGGMLIAHRGREGVRGGGGEMVFLDLWVGLWL
jgi:hypothetical protein